MRRTLTNLFSVQPGEGAKTFLLYALHLMFYVGLRWGENASNTLFVDNWGADKLSLILIAQAVLALPIGIAYSIATERASGERLLLGLVGVTIVWLISVQVLLIGAAPGTPDPAYFYFRLGFKVLGDVTALHILNYINDFYDTRAAKRALPLLSGATIAGAVVANAAMPLINATIGRQNMPLAWGACLVIVIGVVLIVRRQLPAQASASGPSKRRSPSFGGNLLSNFRLVLNSGILRWLALSTVVMVTLMNVLDTQSQIIFKQHFTGNALSNYQATVDLIANIAGIIVASLLFGKMLARLGVGTSNLVFPLLTMLIVAAINFQPILLTAIFGRLSDRTIKKVFRNPLDTMLFNSVPLHIKARARGFINSTTVPLGMLAAGFLVTLRPDQLTAVSLALAGFYIVGALIVRSEYKRALVKLLAEDETAIFRASEADWEAASDPATLQLLEQRLRESTDDNITVFLAETLCDLKGREAIPILQELAAKRSRPAMRASVISLMSEWIDDPAVRQTCLDGIRSSRPVVRRAAALALTKAHTVEQDEEILDAFVEVIDKSDTDTQATLIPPLIASSNFYYLMPAVHHLYEWLSDKRDNRRRALGLRVLSASGDARLIRRLARFLSDPSPVVRAQAAGLIGDLSTHTPLEDMRQLGLSTLGDLLGDPDESVRLAVVEGLGRFRSREASQALLSAMRDDSFDVRRRASTVMQVIPAAELERALTSDDTRLAECAAVVLARSKRLRARRHVLDLCQRLTVEAYRLLIDSAALRTIDAPGARLMATAIQERADRLMDRVFWIVSALSNEQAAESIRRAMRSTTPVARANAIETLESITSPQFAQIVNPLFDGTELAAVARIGQQRLGLPDTTAWDVCRIAWPHLADEAAPRAISDDWLAALGMVTAVDLISTGAPDRSDRVQAALRVAETADAPLLNQTAHMALAQLTSPRRAAVERSMMTVIEKVIFLKEVPFFQGMSVDNLRVLAGIAEETTADAGRRIITEGERGDTLYVIVSGRVGIQRHKQAEDDRTLTQLATLGPREYFAEMSLFDEEPHSADAIAMTPTQLLTVSREPLIELIRRQPDLALGLFKVLSQRLRQANLSLSKKVRA